MSIAHFVAKNHTTILEVLASHFKVDEARGKELLELGAIYSNKRRIFKDAPVYPEQYLRLHLSPKRFCVTSVDWKQRVVANEEEFVVVSKPVGVPTHASLDNAIENCLFQFRKAMNLPLLVTQRLDIPVEGLLVFGKTNQFQAKFNQLLAERKIDKTYEAEVEEEVATGHYLHYMEPSEKSPKKMSANEEPGWLACELAVESIESSPLGYRLRIKLLTGRTHQIRAQLAFMGSPIVGDKLYGSKKNLAQSDKIALKCVELAFCYKGKPYIFRLPPV